MQYGGWFQIAFERDLTAELTTIPVGSLKLLCVRRPSGVEVYDAVCPHRGADLSVNGRLVEQSVVCGYHGYRITLGRGGNERFCVRRYHSITVGGLVFALIGRDDPGELPAFLKALATSHEIVPGWEKTIRVAPELVIENAFDAAHFKPIHDVKEVRAQPPVMERGVFTVDATLRVGPSAWQGGASDDSTFIDVPLLARAFSPNLTITTIAMGGDHPHHVIAGAVPQPDGTCKVRLSIAMPRPADGSAPNQEVAQLILQYESMGLEQDRPVWENLTVDATTNYVPEDATILAYRKFCDQFRFDRAARLGDDKVAHDYRRKSRAADAERAGADENPSARN
jgi:phenylpropionate dioxygenase-like ring-hydroxylating dioxygenase large terminal subunit